MPLNWPPHRPLPHPARGAGLRRLRQCAPRRGGCRPGRSPRRPVRHFDKPYLRGRPERPGRYCQTLPRPGRAPAGGRGPRRPTTCPWPNPAAWRGGAVAAGADLVVQSAHKTLPSLTQTAWLHLNGTLIDPAAVERQLDVFETSSPSYPCSSAWTAAPAGWLPKAPPPSPPGGSVSTVSPPRPGNGAIRRYWASGPNGETFTALTTARSCCVSARRGAAALREAGFEPEMVCGPNVLAMSSPCDAEDALDRLADFLTRRDETAPPPPRPAPCCPPRGTARCTIAQRWTARRFCARRKTRRENRRRVRLGLPARGAAAGPRRGSDLRFSGGRRHPFRRRHRPAPHRRGQRPDLAVLA